jgi:hypothetical protein
VLHGWPSGAEKTNPQSGIRSALSVPSPFFARNHRLLPPCAVPGDHPFAARDGFTAFGIAKEHFQLSHRRQTIVADRSADRNATPATIGGAFGDYVILENDLESNETARACSK